MLDTKILEATEGDDEIEAEVLQAEETTSVISTAKAKIISCLNLTASTAPTEVTTAPSHTTSPTPTIQHHVDNPRESITHLPKLDLPQFAGNPLNWQPFWQSAVDSNRSLTGVQKP